MAANIKNVKNKKILKSQAFGFAPTIRLQQYIVKLREFLIAWVFGKFPKCRGIYFPNAWVFAKFPKCLGIWEISKIPQIPWNLMVVYFKYFRNFLNAWVSGKFAKCLGFQEILGISQIHWYLVKFLNALVIWEFFKMPGYFGNFILILIWWWLISQMHGYLGNFLNVWVCKKYPKCLSIWGFLQIFNFLLGSDCGVFGIFWKFPNN